MRDLSVVDSENREYTWQPLIADVSAIQPRCKNWNWFPWGPTLCAGRDSSHQLSGV